MEENESIKTKPTEVMQLDDSLDDDIKNIGPDSSSVKRDIVIRLKSGDGKLSKNVIKASKNVNKSDEGISKTVNEPHKHAEECLDNFGVGDARNKFENETISSIGKDFHGLPRMDDSVISEEVEKRDDADSIVSSTKNLNNDFRNKAVKSGSAETGRYITATKIIETCDNKTGKTNESIVVYSDSSSDAPEDETSESVGENVCSLQMNSDNMSVRTDNYKNIANTKKPDSSSAKIRGIVKPLKRYSNESSNKPMKKLKTSMMSATKPQHTRLEHIRVSNGNRHKRTVPPKQSIRSFEPENDSTFKLPDNEAETDDRFMICGEPWGIVIDSADADSEQMENDNQHVESSPEKQVSSSTECDKEALQDECSESELPYSIMPSGILDGIVPIRRNIYYCKVCNRLFNSFQSIKAHVSGRQHAQKLSDAKEHVTSASPNEHRKEKTEVQSRLILPDEFKILRDKTFYCNVCKCHITKISEAQNHATKRSHIEKRDREIQNTIDTASLESSRRPKTPSVQNIKRLESTPRRPKAGARKTKAPKSVLRDGGIDVLMYSYYCKICRCMISKNEKNLNQHLNGRSHNMAIQQFKNSLLSTSVPNISLDRPDFWLKDSRSDVRSKDPKSSFERREYVGKIEKSSRKQSYHCTVCDFITNDLESMKDHTRGRKHKESVKMDKERITRNESYLRATAEKEVGMSALREEHHTGPERRVIKSYKDDIGYSERVDKSGRQSYYCTICNYSTKQRRALKDHMHGKRHKKEALRIMKERNPQHKEYYGSLGPYDAESHQSREDPSLDSDYQSDLLWNQCYENFMRFTLNRDDLPQSSELLDLLVKSAPAVVAEQQTVPGNDLSFQSLPQDVPQEEIQDFQQSSFPILRQQQIPASLFPQSEQVPYMPPPQQTPTPYVPPPQQTPTPYVPPPQQTPTPYIPPPQQTPTPYIPPPQQTPTPYIPPHQQTPTPYIPPPQQTPTLYIPPPQQIPIPYIPPPQQTPTPYIPPLQQSQVASLMQPLLHQTESAEESKVNDAPNNYLQYCVTNDTDAEIVIDIIHSLLHTYLKYKLKVLPGSFLKLLRNSSNTDDDVTHTNKPAPGRSVEQLLIDLQKHQRKFQQTFTPVRSDTKPPYHYDHHSFADEKTITATSNDIPSQNEESSLRSIKTTEPSIDELFKKYRNSSSNRTVENNSFSKQYESSINEDTSPRSDKPLNPLLMSYLKSPTMETNRNVDSSQRSTEKNEPFKIDMFEQYESPINERLSPRDASQNDLYKHYSNEYSSSKNTNQNASSVADFSHQNTVSLYEDSSLQNTKQDLSYFIDLIKKYQN